MKRRLIVILLLIVFIPTPAFAINGIGVSPGLQEIELHEGDKQVSFEVVVSNSTDSAVDFRLSTVDFGALDESGGVAFLGRTGQETTYSLSRWMLLDRSELRVEPGKTEAVTVTVNNDDDLSPGGHYGAVMVTSREGGGEQSRSDSVAMLPGASTLVLLKKYGGEKISLSVDSVKANSSLIRTPEFIQLRFKNDGNIHAVPRGTIELIDPFNTILARGVINESSSFVLPGSNRLVDVPLRFSNQPWLPGRYTLKTTWRYDGTDHTETIISHHWYLGKLGIGILSLTSLLIVLYLYVLYRRRPITRN